MSRKLQWIDVFLLIVFVLSFALLLSPLAWAACTNTTWLSLCKPATGDTNWGANWNLNADAVDNAVSGTTEIRPRIKSYTNAGKPSAGTQGRLIQLSDANLQGLYMDDGASTWNRITPKAILTNTASLDFAAVSANTCSDLTMTVTGSADGDAVRLGIPDALASTAGLTFSAWVSAADTVKVRACNVATGASANPAAATVRAWVFKP